MQWQIQSKWIAARVLAICLSLTAIAARADSNVPASVQASHITIEIEAGGDGFEARIAEVVRERILRRSKVAIEVSTESAPGTDLRIALGRRAVSTGSFKALVESYGLTLPGVARVAPEGYAVKLVRDKDGGAMLLAEGTDARGLLYAAGEILRQLEYGSEAVSLSSIDVSTAPAYRFRGSSANQGGTMRTITGARSWTEKEWQDYFLDFALAGANAGYAWGSQFEYLKGFDLMTVGGCRPNQLQGDFPAAWKAGGLEGWEGTNWVCPSVPEARAALMERWEAEFSQTDNHEILRFYAGDPGGCRCSRCGPWGKTFINLCEEVAAIWLKHHPDSIIQIANQDLSNAGDQAIFSYLNEEPRTWLQGIAYGPGSNALSHYFRDELRNDLFEYPGTGPLNRYLAEILNNIPKQQTITHYSDITHWVHAQYNLENPDPYLVKAYDRRTFHTRPVAFYKIFQAIMPFSEGDIIYSEGYHDEFHQYMWNRLLWDPNRSLDEVMAEYCRYHFGPEAAPDMVAAMLQLEKNLELPLADNAGIDAYYVLVKEAGWKIPPHRMADNYRWMLHMQKAALDKYNQLRLRRELARDAELVSLAKNDPDNAVARAKTLLVEALETPDMAALREEARRLGEESDRIIGVRNLGYFTLDKPLTTLGWTVSQFEAAGAATGEARRTLLWDLAHYEDAGPGGFYDDAGVPGRQPHLVKGFDYDATSRMAPGNRPSQNTLVYSMEDPQGVVFRYTGLDPVARYQVRVTLGRPRRNSAEEEAKGPKQLQSILADGEYLVRDVEMPVLTPQTFAYDVPHSATGDGSLELIFERDANTVFVMVSEVWLLKK